MMFSSDEIALGTSIVAMIGAGVAAFWKFWKSIAVKIAEHEKRAQDRIDANEAKAAAREAQCVSRLQGIEDQRRDDYREVIGACTRASIENTASNRELTGAVDRMAVAVASMPAQRDPAEVMARLKRQANDFSPHSGAQLIPDNQK